MSKVVIVACVGPGLAVAKRFTREGFKAALIARDARKPADLVQEIVAAGRVAEAFPADHCDLEALKRTFATIQARLGPAEILVYNGARWYEAPVMQLGMIFDWDLALCATGALACAQHVYPAMKSAGRGTMLFTGGGLALHPEYGKGVSSLTAGKSALRRLVFAMVG